jgi:cardiolipin synthase
VLVTILTTGEVLYVVVLATWILFEKRPPVSTLAWILALVGLPYVGFVVFFFLGPRRLKRTRLKHRRARRAARGAGTRKSLEARAAPATEALPEPEDPRARQLARLAFSAGEPPVDRCEEVTIFHDAASTYDAIVDAIGKAEHHIHLGYYIFESGRAADRISEALVARAKAGVVVRVLVDDVGSSGMKRSLARTMHDSGIILARFNPVRFSRLRGGRVDFRNHRKILVCDGRVGFTGGINICDDYIPEAEEQQTARARRGHPAPWRDTHLRIEGDAVRWLQLTFTEDWYFATHYVPGDRHYFPAPTGKGSHHVQIVGSGPDLESEPIQKLYFSAITLAKERVFVTTPYFVPDDAILTALTTAALRGVDVRILVPRRSDSFIVTAAARSYYDGIIESGGRVYEYQPTMVHAKTLVVDDLLASIGTANMDNRSFRLNFEVTAVLYGKGHAQNLAAQFERDLAEAERIDKSARTRIPIGWRIAEAGARVLSPLL